MGLVKARVRIQIKVSHPRKLQSGMIDNATTNQQKRKVVEIVSQYVILYYSFWSPFFTDYISALDETVGQNSQV